MTTTFTLLKRVDEFVTEANKTNGTNKKIEIIKKYPDLKKLFYYINYNQITFGITSKAYKKYLKKKKPAICIPYVELFDILDAFKDRRITGGSASESLKHFINQYAKYEEIILKIIDRNLKTKTNTKAINKAFPGLIPVFEVVLAQTYEEERRDKLIKKGFTYYLSRKLDGVRCICFYEDYGKSIRFFSREGNEFLNKKTNKATLVNLYEPLRKLFDGIESVVLDGEICIVDENGLEDFQKVVSEVKKHVNNPRYYLFDILNKTEFQNGEGKRLFKRRYERLEMYKNMDPAIKILEQIVMNDKTFKMMIDESAKNDWEGFMIRRNFCYKSGRSKDLLKHKTMMDKEFTVLKVLSGTDRRTSKKTGLEIEVKTTAALVIDFYGTKVGTGLNDEEKDLYYKHPELIVGKKITVKFQGYTQNKNKKEGELSLRFPSFKGIRNYE